MEHYSEDPNDDSRPSNFRACQVCRQRKVKCVAVPEGDSCEYCKKHNVECVQIEPVQKRRRQNTQAELKARVEQLEERLSQTLSEQARSGQLPSVAARKETFVAHQAPNGHPSQYLPTRSSPPTIQSQPTSPYVGQYTNMRPIRRPTSLDHLLAQDQPKPQPSFEMYPSPNLNIYPPTLPPPPPPAASPLLRNSIDTYSLHSLGSRFSPSSERFNQRATPVSDTKGRYRDPTQVHGIADYANDVRRSANPDTPTYHPAVVDNKDATTSRSSSKASPADVVDDTDEPSSVRKILGPIPAFDASFHELCLRRGLATHDDQQCERKDKFWTRFFRLSNDPTLKLYQISFPNPSLLHPDYEGKSEVPSSAIAQVRSWTESYGDCLLETFRTKIAPRYAGCAEDSEILIREDLLNQPVSLTCALYALSALCVDSWTLKKRLYLGLAFHSHAMTYLQKELIPVSLKSIRVLFLLADFSVGAGASLLNSWVLSHAFELRLNIDPEHWQVPEREKEIRRRMFWLIMVNDRFSAMERNAPSVEHDHYDTKTPAPITSMGETRLLDVEVSEIVAKICNSFYSVRGARLVHGNVAISSTISLQLEEMLVKVKARHLTKFPSFEKLSDSTTGFAIAMSLLNIELGIIMIHRPFSGNSSLNLIESLEHHRKSIDAASECINIFNRMPDSYFTESWPTHSRHLLATIMITLLQESLLSPDEHLRAQAKHSLDVYMDVVNRQTQRWMMCRFCCTMMRLASALSGENYGVRQYGDLDEVPVENVESHDSAEGGQDNSPWSSLEWERLAAYEWDDLSQMFGVSNLSNEWFMPPK